MGRQSSQSPHSSRTQTRPSVDTAVTPQSAQLANRHRTGRSHRRVTHPAPLEMVYNPQVHPRGARSSRSPAPLQELSAQHSTIYRRHLRTDDKSGGTRSQGRTPTYPRANDLALLHPDARRYNGRAPTGCTDPHMDHDSSRRLRLATRRTRRFVHAGRQQECVGISHLLPRQGRTSSRPLHRPHRSLTPPLASTHSRSYEVVTNETVSRDHDDRYAARVPGCEERHGGQELTQRVPTGARIERDTDPNPDAFQRTHERANSSQIPLLGPTSGRDSEGHDHRRSLPYSTDDRSNGRDNGIISTPARAPTWAALAIGPRHNRNDAPLHVKPVIAALNLQHNAFESCYQLINRWLFPSPWYKSLPLREPSSNNPTTRTTLSAADIVTLRDAGKLELAQTSETPFFCNAFAVLEERPSGVRRRPIFEPEVNAFVADQEARTTYPDLLQIRTTLANNSWAALFDYASWFDQIALHPDIRCYFRVHPLYQLTTLPMGFRTSCRIAQCLSEAILKAARIELPFLAYVDNTLIAGQSREDVVTASKRFIQTCASVNAVLNDDPYEPSQNFCFLGECYDLERRTRCNTEKTTSKCQALLDFLKSHHTTVTIKQVMAFFGLLFFSRRVLSLPIAEFHLAIRFLAQVSREFNTHRNLRARVAIPALVNEQLMQWCHLSVKNQPVPIIEEAPPPTLTIYVDASHTGWGAIAVSAAGAIQSIALPWTVDQRMRYNLARSTVAEPLALRLAAAYFLSARSSHASVIFFTDHLPLVFAFAAGFGRCSHYSAAIHALQQHSCFIAVHHVPGAANPADVLSRQPPPYLPVTSIGSRKHR